MSYSSSNAVVAVLLNRPSENAKILVTSLFCRISIIYMKVRQGVRYVISNLVDISLNL